MLSAVRRITEAKHVFEPIRDANNGSLVREGIEAVFAVVGAVAGVANAAEGGVRDAGVHGYVVYGDPAGLGV